VKEIFDEVYSLNRGFMICANRILLLVLAVGAAVDLHAQSASSQVRVAVLSEERLASAADLLITQLSKRKDIALVEREQLQKIVKEQTWATLAKDYVKVGQLLGAD